MKPAEPMGISLCETWRVFCFITKDVKVMPTTTGAKPFLNYDEQLALLRERGLIIANPAAAKETLRKTNYYRFSAYSLTLRKDDVFYPQVTFEDIETLYHFDAEIRKLVFEFGSIAEIAARSYIAYYHAEKYGPLGYLNNQNFQSEQYHAAFLQKLYQALDKSSDPFVLHHRNEKGGVYPFWVAVEEITFGALSLLYKNMLAEDRANIARTYYGIPRKYVENAMQCAVVARNMAAHGGRFYNRKNLKPAVLLPVALERAGVKNDQSFAYLYALYVLLPDEHRLTFINAIRHAFRKYSFAQPRYLGFPEDWENLILQPGSARRLQNHQ